MKPGIELDALIAEKVMGLQICGCDHEKLREEYYLDFQGTAFPYTSICDYASHGSDRRCNHCTKLYLSVVHYSTDIAAAWEIVTELENREWGFILNNIMPNFPTWQVKFGCEERVCTADAPTAPHAICLAALKAMEE